MLEALQRLKGQNALLPCQATPIMARSQGSPPLCGTLGQRPERGAVIASHCGCRVCVKGLGSKDSPHGELGARFLWAY